MEMLGIINRIRSSCCIRKRKALLFQHTYRTEKSYTKLRSQIHEALTEAEKDK